MIKITAILCAIGVGGGMYISENTDIVKEQVRTVQGCHKAKLILQDVPKDELQAIGHALGAALVEPMIKAKCGLFWYVV